MAGGDQTGAVRLTLESQSAWLRRWLGTVPVSEYGYADVDWFRVE
jgi:hypothetical protein